MKRKTFVKELMALGFQRNETNRLCREAIEMAVELRRDGIPVEFAWEGILAHVCEQLTDIIRRGKGTTWCNAIEYKYCKWVVKRRKKYPTRNWERNYPNNI